MKFILGLDPGIASIGWALILEAENDNEQSRIIDSNVVKVDFDNFAYTNAKGKISEGKPIDMFRKGLTVLPDGRYQPQALSYSVTLIHSVCS